MAWCELPMVTPNDREFRQVGTGRGGRNVNSRTDCGIESNHPSPRAFMLINLLRLLLGLTVTVILSSCVATRDVLHLGEEVAVVQTETRPRWEAHLICWNVHKAEDRRFQDEVQELLAALPGKDRIILCLQEVRCSTFDFIKNLHPDRVRGHYAASWRSPLAQGSTGVLTMGNWESRTAGVERINSPGREAYVVSPKVALRTQLAVPGGASLQVINCHGLNVVPKSRFGRQLDEIFATLRDPGQPAIVCGDFNTWSPGRLEILRAKAAEVGFKEADAGRPARSPAPRWLRCLSPINGFDPDLPLDRVFTRGVEVQECYYVNYPESSDHLPLVLRFTMDLPSE